MVDDDGGLREKWDFSLWLMMMAVQQRQRASLGIKSKSNLGKVFTCTLDWLVSASRDIHVTGFGARKPRVKVGQAMCKKISLFYFFVSHFSFPR